MSNKRKYSDDENDKQYSLRKEIKRLRRKIDRHMKDRACYYRDRHEGRYREKRNKRSNRRDHYDNHNHRGRHSSRSISGERYSRDRSGSLNRTQSRSRDSSPPEHGSRSSSASGDRLSVSPRGGDIISINATDDTGKTSQSNQAAQVNEAEAIQPNQGSHDATRSIELDLDPEILQALGERIHPDRKLAPPIHTKFVAGIEEVIKKGVPADKRKALIEKFPSPENCLMMDPPKLNPELKACLQEALAKRDGRIVEKQVRITASLAGLLNVLTKITSLKSDEKLPIKELTESLWGILQLIADLQHVESSIRRSLILKNISASMKEALNATAVDVWLFGEKLDEKVKAAKTLENSSRNLKPNTSRNQSNQSKNSKRPFRRQSYRSTHNSSASGRKSYQSYQKQRQPSRRPTQQKDNQQDQSTSKKQE